MGRPSEADVAADLEVFAAFVREGEQREREAKAAARAERRAANERRSLEQAKDEAAATLKRLRGRSGVSSEERQAAEEAYRRALAAVVAAESGETPEWAPPAEETAEDPAPPSAGDDLPDADATTDGDAVAEADAAAEGDGSPDDHAE